jgi:hypothetical protein
MDVVAFNEYFFILKKTRGDGDAGKVFYDLVR